MFIYDALNEYIICGQTEIPAEKMKETYEDLSEKLKTTSGTESTGFEQQFQVTEIRRASMAITIVQIIFLVAESHDTCDP